MTSEWELWRRLLRQVRLLRTKNLHNTATLVSLRFSRWLRRRKLRRVIWGTELVARERTSM